MNKLFLAALAALFMTSSVCVARVGDEEKSHKDEHKDAQRSEDKELKKERKKERKREREQKMAEEKEKKAEKKEHKALKKEKRKETPKAERKADSKQEKAMKREQKQKEKEMRKAEKESKKAEKDARKEQKLHEKGKTKKLEKREEKKAAKAERADRKDARRQRRVERKDKRHDHAKRLEHKVSVAQQKREDAYVAGYNYDQQREHNRYNALVMARKDRTEDMGKWKTTHAAKIAKHIAGGEYAYLYKSPAWPTAALFYPNKDQVTVSVNYQYATDAYDSAGSGSKSDITKLAFGENPITIKEILLASKLLTAKKVVTYRAAAVSDTFKSAQGFALQYLTDEVLHFNGKAESYGASIGLSRYVLNNDVAIGIDIPVLNKKHKLSLSAQIDETKINAYVQAAAPGRAGAIGPALDSDPAFASATRILSRYLNQPELLALDILSAKGINELGGSATGLGDISLFASCVINSTLVDKAIVGLRFQVPTGKEASQNKLWAPDLGNGGFPEIALFGSTFVSYKKYINPHLMTEASFSLPSHVDRRVPKRVAMPELYAENATPVTPAIAQVSHQNLMVWGDRTLRADSAGIAVAHQHTAVPFDEYDTTIRGFGDNISDVRITKGPELKMRLGNIIEKFISRRGFLDIFYDFRAKMKDNASGLPIDQYNVEILRDHTQQLEHKIGFDYSYQYDIDTRARLGMRYTFAGINVPKTFEAVGSLNYSF